MVKRLSILSFLAVSLLVLTGCQSIQIAAAKGNLEAVRFQLSVGVNANSKNLFSRETALIEAAKNGHLDIVKLLIEKGADVNLQGEAFYGPLHMAAANGHLEIVKFLLKKGADVNLYQGHDKPLHHAARGGYIEIARLLLAHGTDVNAKGIGDWTPLSAATSGKQLQMVEFLIQQGADVNAQADYGCTPLYQAYLADNAEIGKILLDHGADSSIKCGSMTISQDFLAKLHQ